MSSTPLPSPMIQYLRYFYMPTPTPSTTQSAIIISGVRRVVISLLVPQSHLQKVTAFLQNLNKGDSRNYPFVIVSISGDRTYIDVTVPDHQEGLFYELLWHWTKKEELTYDGVTAGDVYAREAILNAHRSLMDNLKIQGRFGYRPK